MIQTAKKVNTGISLDREVLETVDKRRREIALESGKDLARSAYINMLIKKALVSEK